ncbi:hypothetical protein V6N13_105433 [Hibiscus sabdariffa]|uniref:Uncharacterized protein n=1 Tax=Hibiscus sabdariffa TaxID=183260 RepID=A0ABR2EWV2_9ROSI
MLKTLIGEGSNGPRPSPRMPLLLFVATGNGILKTGQKLYGWLRAVVALAFRALPLPIGTLLVNLSIPLPTCYWILIHTNVTL